MLIDKSYLLDATFGSQVDACSEGTNRRGRRAIGVRSGIDGHRRTVWGSLRPRRCQGCEGDLAVTTRRGDARGPGSIAGPCDLRGVVEIRLHGQQACTVVGHTVEEVTDRSPRLRCPADLGMGEGTGEGQIL